MSTAQSVFVGLLVGSLFLLALFVEPPAWADAAFGWVRSWFTRGRHHVHAPLPARPFERERPTVEQIAARIRREGIGRVQLTIVPDVEVFRADLRRQLAAIG